MVNVLVIGRANVGKSSFCNIVLGRRKSIVHEQEGVTRDIVSSNCIIKGKEFNIVDTAGLMVMIEEKKKYDFNEQIVDKLLTNIIEAYLVIFICDATQGLLPLDKEIYDLLRKYDKKVLCVANKVDNEKLEFKANEFYALGIDKLFCISCYHKTKIRDFIDYMTDLLPERKNIDSDKEEKKLYLSIIGKPNVGKSSLVNYFIKEDKMIVSDIAGTTRDSVDFKIKLDSGNEVYLTDTAGIKRKRAIKNPIELFSMFRSQEAIEKCDIVFFMLDISQGINSTDKKIFSMIDDYKKPYIILINKTDSVNNSEREIENEFKEKFKFINQSQILTISVKEEKNLNEIFSCTESIVEQIKQNIPTPVVNNFIRDLLLRRPPSIKGSRRFHIYYITVDDSKVPFRFIIFCNKKSLLSSDYLKFMEKSIKKSFNISFIPIEFVFKEKN